MYQPNRHRAATGGISEPLNVELSGNNQQRKRCRPPVLDSLLLAASIVGIVLIFVKVVPRWCALLEKEAEEQSDPNDLVAEMFLATTPLVVSAFVAGNTSRGIIRSFNRTMGSDPCSSGKKCCLSVLAFLVLCGAFAGSGVGFVSPASFFSDLDADAIQLRRNLGAAGFAITGFLFGCLSRGGVPDCDSSAADSESEEQQSFRHGR